MTIVEQKGKLECKNETAVRLFAVNMLIELISSMTKLLIDEICVMRDELLSY